MIGERYTPQMDSGKVHSHNHIGHVAVSHGTATLRNASSVNEPLLIL